MRASPEELLRTECGTRSYMAPEVLARQQYDGSKVRGVAWRAPCFLLVSVPVCLATPGRCKVVPYACTCADNDNSSNPSTHPHTNPSTPRD